MIKFAETHNEARRWLRRYRKSGLCEGLCIPIYIRTGIAVAIFFDYADCRSDMVKYTSERDVTSLGAVIHRSIYDLRFCLGEGERKGEGQRVTRHCKIDGDLKWILCHIATARSHR